MRAVRSRLVVTRRPCVFASTFPAAMLELACRVLAAASGKVPEFACILLLLYRIKFLPFFRRSFLHLLLRDMRVPGEGLARCALITRVLVCGLFLPPLTLLPVSLAIALLFPRTIRIAILRKRCR